MTPATTNGTRRPGRRAPRARSLAFRAVRQLLLVPVYAIPFALFFGTLFGSGWRSYWIAYQLSLVFSATITAAMFALGALGVGGRDAPGTHPSAQAVIRTGLVYVGTAMGASFVAATIVHLTILPGFLGGPRQFLLFAMFSLVFSVLALGISYSIHFYQQALARVRAEEELNLARRIQRSFLLSNFPELPGLEVHATNVSSREVSGDFYDLVNDGDRAWLLAIADVSGKGVPAALLTSMLQASLRTQAGRGLSVSEILTSINRLVCQNEASGQFATFFLARYEQDSQRLTFSNAGHNYPVVFRERGEREFLVKGGVVVGFLDDARFEEATVALRPGDRLVFYTDGVTEAARADGEMFDEERLYELVSAIPPHLGARETAERILAGVRAFLDGTEAADDITLMVLRVLDRPAAASGA